MELANLKQGLVQRPKNIERISILFARGGLTNHNVKTTKFVVR